MAIFGARTEPMCTFRITLLIVSALSNSACHCRFFIIKLCETWDTGWCNTSDGNLGVFPFSARFIVATLWVCLKIGYSPNYSHLIGISADPGRRKGERVREEEVLHCYCCYYYYSYYYCYYYYYYYRPSLPWCVPIRGIAAARGGKSRQNHHALWVPEVTLGGILPLRMRHKAMHFVQR